MWVTWSGDRTGSWLMAVAAGFASAALFGLVLQVAVFRFMHGEDLRQTLVTIGLSIMMADILLWVFGGEIYQFDPPRAIFGRDAPAHRGRCIRPTGWCCSRCRPPSASCSGGSSIAPASG